MLTIGNSKECGQEAISLYFHIPFCTKKCSYCHFYVLPDKAPFHSLLMEGLLLDLQSWALQLANKRLISIYFGGGTPSLLGANALSDILQAVQKYIPFDPAAIEITLEANPETVTLELMRDYASAGVNRVSIGVQSLDDGLLVKLGRTHYAAAAIRAIETTANAGIPNISIDLMYDIPGQTLASWKHTIHQMAPLPITHLSLYNLTIEPHTVFFKYRESLLKELPDAECSTAMYKSAVEVFEACGLHQYEISAFAKDSLYSRHNVGYWLARPFLGFGPSAFSYWKRKRMRAVANLQKYVQTLREGKSPLDFSEELPAMQHRNELLAIALRLKQGVDLMGFEASHGALDVSTKNALQKLQSEGLLMLKGDVISLTERGVLFYDTVAVDII